MFRKRSPLSKLWLKFTDRAAYKAYKWDLKNFEKDNFYDSYAGSGRLSTLPQIVAAGEANQGELNVSHSGNAGDVIYSLTALKKIHEMTGLKINIFLNLNQPLNMVGFRSHPLGNVMLNEKMAEMLRPLLTAQSYIHGFGVLTDQKIHVNLDFFRSGAFNLINSNSARWSGYQTGVSPDLWKKWLDVTPDLRYRDKIVITRTERYRNTSIDYSFLNRYDNVICVGVESEYHDIKKVLPRIEWVKVDDFYQLASIMAGCKFFIGNQSFPFSVAEALKIPRILEVYYHITNVIPEGENAHDFFFQSHFEWLVEHLNGQSVLKS